MIDSRANRAGDAGLSLIEVLVSLAIFAIIGIAGLAVLNTVARTGERTEGRLERLAEVDRAFLVVRRDLAQIKIAEIGLVGDVLSFGRASGGRTIRIAYVLDDDIWRRQINGAKGVPVDQQLLTGIASAKWRLLDGARRWHSDWPPVGSVTPSRPMAAELTLDIWREGAGRPASVTRLIVLPAGQSR